MFLKYISLLLLLISLTNALKFSPLLTDNLILQRNKYVNIWGTSTETNEIITLTLSINNSEEIYTNNSSENNWNIIIPPHSETSGDESYTITVRTLESQIQIKNVLFGDLYLCSGQSNMETTASYSSQIYGNEFINYADYYTKMRWFQLPEQFSKTTDEIPTTNNPITNATNDTIPIVYIGDGGSWTQVNSNSISSFGKYYDFGFTSAVCYFTMINLYNNTNGTVPIGFIDSSYGGTQIESWMSPSSINIAEDICNPLGYKKDGYYLKPGLYNDGKYLTVPPSQIYNAMLYPLVPFNFTTMIWYQGEANCDKYPVPGFPHNQNALIYGCTFPIFISDIRKTLKNPTLPFYFVQLAPYNDTFNGGAYTFGGSNSYYLGQFALFRQMQRLGLSQPYTGMVNAIDLGDLNESLESNIHTRNKYPIGFRLSKLISGIVQDGPIINSVSYDNVNIIVSFDLNSIGEYLYLKGSSSCVLCCNLTPFTVNNEYGNETGILLPVVEIDKNNIFLSIPENFNVTLITSFQLQFEDYPQCILYNSNGIPAFQTSIPLKI